MEKLVNGGEMNDFKLTPETVDVLSSKMLTMRYSAESYQVFLDIASYTNGNIYIGLDRIEDGPAGPHVESAADLTVNLPGYLLGEDEAFISHDFQKEKLAFIKENRLGVRVGEPVHRGMADYVLVAFDRKRLEELNPVIALEKAGIMQTEPKIVSFLSEDGDTPVSLYVHAYDEGGRLRIELIDHEDPDFLTPFGDMTANLPEFPIKPNEAFINKDASADILNFIRANGLGEVLPYTVLSGNDEYAAVAFDLDKLAEFDPEGVEDYKKSRHMERTPAVEGPEGFSDLKPNSLNQDAEPQQKSVRMQPGRKR